MTSCGNNESPNSSVTPYHLAFAGPVKLALDSVTKMSLQDNGFNGYQDTTLSPNDLVVLYNRAVKRLQYHDLVTGQMLRTVPLETEGPNGIGESFFSLLVNQDSLFLLEPYAYRLFLVDRQGKVSRAYRLLNGDVKFDPGNPGMPPSGAYSALPDGGFGRSMVKAGKHLFIGGYANIGGKEDGSYIEQALTCIKLDLETGKLQYGVHFPPAYDRKAFYPTQAYLEFSFAYNPQKNELAYSFPAAQEVFKVSPDLNTMGEGVLAQSKHGTPFTKMRKYITNADEEYLHFMQQTNYLAMLYDPYREVYYRFVYHPQAGAFPTPILKSELKITHSIMILDKDLRVIGEQLFDKYLFTPRAFVGKKGLYIEGAPQKWLQETKFIPTEDVMLLSLLTLKPGVAND